MVSGAVEPTLALALRALLPAADETLLLRACLLHDARGADAWKQFKAEHGELTELFRTDRGELRRLGPLLSQGLKESGAEVEPRVWTVLRTGRMREGLRGRIFQEVLRETLDALRRADIPNIVLRGAASGELAYGDIALRHSHDIDLLIAEAFHARAIAALEPVGFVRDAQRPLEGGQRRVVSLTHRTSLPVRLHTALLELKGYEGSSGLLEQRSRTVQLAGTQATALSAEDALLQTVAHASYSPTRYTLQWAADAWMIIATNPALDWTLFAARCIAARVSLPVSVLLQYLAQELDAPVPRVALNTLAAAAASSSELERDCALFGARAGAKTGLAALFTATPGLGNRVRLATWLLKPSAEYVAWAQNAAPTRRGGGLPGRLFRYARQRLTAPR